MSPAATIVFRHYLTKEARSHEVEHSGSEGKRTDLRGSSALSEAAASDKWQVDPI